jgi:hypothetical protein
VVSAALAERDTPVVLFDGASPTEVTIAATEAANALADVIRQRKLSQKIAGREHVRVEGWQTLGALVGVFAVEAGGVRELHWPVLAALGEEPDPRDPTRAAWEYHRVLLAQRDLGRAYGYSVAYKAVKDGREVGWGEGRCSRGEKTWVARDDYALASMAQTRGQGRTLKQPLGFLIHLAGYATTPYEEMSETAEPATGRVAELEAELAAVKTRHLLYGALVDADGDALAARIIDTLFADVDGTALVGICNRRFGTDHLPDAAAKMVDALRWAHDSDSVRAKAQENAPPDPDVSAYHGAPPDE